MPSISVVDLFIIFLSFHLISSCPEECRCDRRKNVYCNERNLFSIPLEVPIDTKVLHLQTNNISNEKDFDLHLSHLKSLKRLYLQQNMLTFVPSDLPKRLEIIDMNMNDIKYVSHYSFRRLNQLQELHLEENDIVDLGLLPDAFKDTQKLKVILLSNNFMTEFPLYLPKSLLILHLKYNLIEAITINSTKNLSKLNKLDISNNRLVQAGIERGAMAALSSLGTLDMSQNRLTEVPKKLPESLEELLLSHNSIQYIYSSENEQHGSFRSLRNLKILDLSFNNLKSVKPLSFSGLQINAIEMHKNPWQCDCYLTYLKKWLASDMVTVSAENDIQCQSPPNMTSVSLNSIEENILVCKSRLNSLQMINVVSVSSHNFKLEWRNSVEIPEPPFIQRFVLYGPMACKNCSISSLPSADQLKKAVSFMETYNIQSATSLLNLTIDFVVGNLQPETNYVVCVFDSLQNETDIIINQCLHVVTLKFSSNSTFLNGFWSFAIFGILIVIVCISGIGYALFKGNLNSRYYHIPYISSTSTLHLEPFQHRKIKPSVETVINALE